jgi:hypothetical protein
MLSSGHRLSDIRGAAAIVALAGAMVVAAASDQANAVCSVFDGRPCAPTVCSVFRHGPCIPEIEYPIGQDLRLTIESVRTDDNPTAANASAHTEHHDAEGERKLNSIGALFAALRACWVPPAMDVARPGFQMSVRFAFTRTGEIIAAPRVTYVTPDTPGDVRDLYHTAIAQSLERCTPIPFTRGMGGAIAGRPIAIRFVDNRSKDDAAVSATTQNSK